jgi:hypothetical protein
VSRSNVGAVDAVKGIDAIFDIEREVNGRSIKDRPCGAA